MAKPEWGTKRICQSCTSRFYDFGRLPIICPSCGAEFDPEAILKSRRGRVASREKANKEAEKARKAKAAEAEAEAETETEAEVALDDDSDLEVGDDEVDEAVIEDTDDLGGDDEDLGDVPVTKDDDES